VAPPKPRRWPWIALAAVSFLTIGIAGWTIGFSLEGDPPATRVAIPRVEPPPVVAAHPPEPPRAAIVPPALPVQEIEVAPEPPPERRPNVRRRRTERARRGLEEPMGWGTE
jgi:hypothetical protein